jgi:hypothetical protein
MRQQGKPMPINERLRIPAYRGCAGSCSIDHPKDLPPVMTPKILFFLISLPGTELVS